MPCAFVRVREDQALIRQDQPALMHATDGDETAELDLRTLSVDVRDPDLGRHHLEWLAAARTANRPPD
jgi:hypothetical protein